MNAEIITEEDLMELAQVKQRKALEQWLDQHGIRYLQGRSGRISTTRTWLNNPNDELEFVGGA